MPKIRKSSVSRVRPFVLGVIVRPKVRDDGGGGDPVGSARAAVRVPHARSLQVRDALTSPYIVDNRVGSDALSPLPVFFSPLSSTTAVPIANGQTPSRSIKYRQLRRPWRRRDQYATGSPRT